MNVGGVPTPQVFSISATWDTGPELYDIVKVYFTGLGSHSAVTSMKGRLSGVGGNLYVPTGAGGASGGVFGANTTESKIGTYTAINLDQVTGTFVRQSGTDASNWAAWIEGTWATTNVNKRLNVNAADPDVDGLNENLLVEFLVAKSATAVTFGNPTTGSSTFGYSTAPTSAAASFSLVQPVVPEPSTLALLASGLFGLVAYAWRKRK